MWITGLVVDASGRALPGVTIEACRQGTPCKRAAITDAAGRYVLQDLQPGIYTFAFLHEGFARLGRTTDALTSYVATINARLTRRSG
jgi:hypothetical protein